MQLHDIELDDDFHWINEFEHNPIEQKQEHSLTGALLIQEGVKLYARRIELRSDGGVWTPLSVVRQLEALRDQPSFPMKLMLGDGREFYVIWDRTNGSPLSAEPLWRETYPATDSEYLVNLRLITVAPPPPVPEP